MPKPAAFLPSENSLKMSAIWVDELAEDEVWQIGDHVGEGRQKPALGRADFQARVVSELELTIEPDPAPHPRHVNICGWPLEKDQRIAIAQDLCVRSALRIRPENH